MRVFQHSERNTCHPNDGANGHSRLTTSRGRMMLHLEHMTFGQLAKLEW